MIFVDTLMAKGLFWVMENIGKAALAEFKDDSPLREALVEAGVRLELGEITPEDFALLEDQLLARINAIRAMQDVDTGPIAFPGLAEEDEGGSLAVEAGIAGDFHEPEARSPQGERARRKRRAGAHLA